MALLQRNLAGTPSAMTAQDRADYGETFEPANAVTESVTLAWPAMAGQYQIVDSATPVAIALPSDVGIPLGTTVKGVNIGAGAVSFAGTGIVLNAILPSTVDQYSPFELRRITGGWVRIA